MLLADLGADVVRPETESGDHRRPPPRVEPRPVCWDRGKRRVILPCLEPRADTALSSLLSAADVVLLDGGPRALAAAGWDLGEIEQTYPELVISWLPAMGARGPYADLPADPLLQSAISGYAQQQTSIEAVPIAPVVPIVSYVHGALGAAATVAALLERRRSGRGQVVTVTGLHAVASLEAAVMLAAQDQPALYKPGRDARSMPAFRAYECADGEWFFLGTLVETLFVGAMAALDMLELMVLPGVEGEFTNLLRTAAGLAVAERLEALFAQQPRAHWLEILTEADIPVAPVLTRSEWLASDALKAVGGLVTRTHPELGPVRLPAPGVALSVTPPVVGELAREVSADELLAHWSPRSTLGDGSTHTNGALAGLRVLDLATFIAGPFGPTIMAQWGADVVKVETLEGDPYRVYSLSFVAINQGKRSVAVDLRHPDGKQLLLDLVAQADVLVENLRGESLARLGLSESVLQTLNPQLVHCSVTAFGQRGPLAGTPGFDPLLQARSGLMHTVGAEGHPVSTGTPVHDVGSASLTTLGALAALWALPTTGVGQRVDVALASSTLLLQSGEYTDFEGRPPSPRGGVDFVGPTAARRYYRTADHWMALAAQTAEQLEAALQVLGLEGEPDLDAPGDGALARAIATVMATRKAPEVVEELQRRGVPAAPVPPQNCLDDEHLVANDFSHVVMDRQFGRCRVVKNFAEWSRSAVYEATSMPAKGEDGPDVLLEIGWDSEAMGRVIADGTVQS